MSSMPERYGLHSTSADRLARWECSGLWDWLLTQMQMQSDAVGEVVWEVSAESTSMRVHTNAAGGEKGGRR